MSSNQQHTPQTLKGIFNPCPTLSNTKNQHETPSMSISRTKSMAHGSILSRTKEGGINTRKKRKRNENNGDLLDPGDDGEVDGESVDSVHHWEGMGSDSGSGNNSSSEASGTGSDSSDGDGDDNSSDSDSVSTVSSSSRPPPNAPSNAPPAAGGVVPPPIIVGKSGIRCFLCDYCTSQEVRFVTTFIADNIANMEIGFMAEQIRKYILDKRPEYAEPYGAHGLEVISIKRHIKQHMLSPTVRIADMMRHLLKLCDTLRLNLERVDPETGESTADRSQIDIYLKVVTKVLDMYKMSETNKMLFANTEK